MCDKTTKMTILKAFVRWVGLLILAACSAPEDPGLQPRYDPGVVQAAPVRVASPPNPLRNLYFGDLHIHTSLSTDAWVMGVRAMPDDAYRFAKGHTIEHGAGYPIQISRPLDFAAVTDHSEYLGQARAGNLDVPLTRRSLRDRLLNDNTFSITRAWLGTTTRMREFGFTAGPVDKSVNERAWQEVIRSAEAHNQPGVFTSFIGYEWSAHVGDDVSVHVHRNVIYRGSDVTNRPFSSLDSNQPEGLWRFLEAENQAGRDVLAIPHNANISNGNMYGNLPDDVTASYADRRNRLEPVHEILQVKGASEVHPLLSVDDEFADFSMVAINPLSDEVQSEDLRGSFARYALMDGIASAADKGTNPFMFGVIGSSDSHNASSPVEEDNYHGKLPMMDGSAGLRTSEATLLPVGFSPANSWSSGGLAAVWAEENTRESIYAALAQRETFATSGPRISVRLFAGDELGEAILADSGVIEEAYRLGVPMGGRLPASTRAPRLLVLANRDPDGADLDRVQVIKGWVGEDGTAGEKVFDLAVTGGSASIEQIWADPEFEPAHHAFYYVRVLEVPSKRWSTYDAESLGTEPLEPAWIQERAITSAIWYSPD